MVTKVRLDIDVRPWGSYYVSDKGTGYLVKQLKVKPESRTSLQYHNHRDEVWVVVHGSGIAWHTAEDGTLNKDIIQYGATIKVFANFPHRIENISETEDLILVEVQLGIYLYEEDIIRVQDDYGRV